MKFDTQWMSTIELCDVTALARLFGVLMETNKHQNLTRLAPGYKQTSKFQETTESMGCLMRIGQWWGMMLSHKITSWLLRVSVTGQSQGFHGSINIHMMQVSHVRQKMWNIGKNIDNQIITNRVHLMQNWSVDSTLKLRIFSIS